MKKVYIMLMVSLLLCACSDDSNDVATSSLAITQSEVEYSAVGGTGSITVVGDGGISSATSSEEWCGVTVNGNTINLIVAKYEGSETRNSVITIRDNKGGKVHVAVSQTGVRLILAENKQFLFNDDAAQGNVRILSHSLDVTLSTGKWSSWLSASLDGDNVVFHATPNNTGDVRSGYVYCMCGERIDSILVVQCEKKDVYGDWYISTSGTVKTGDLFDNIQCMKVNLSESAEDGKIKMTFLDWNGSTDFDFDDTKMQLSWNVGKDVGTYTGVISYRTSSRTYDLRTSVQDADYQYQFNDTTISSTAYISNNGENVVWRFKDNGSWAGHQVTTIGVFFAVNLIWGAGENAKALVNPYMIRADKFTPPTE